MPKYRTVAAAVRHEIEPIHGSRFVADASSVASAEAALGGVARIRALEPDASHHCWAYRLAPSGGTYRMSDAGEPRGSAGVPILKRIKGKDLVNVLVVVTRWFGGTKLGVGGLMRAYGGAAAAVLADASLVEVIERVRIQVRYPYGAEGRVQALLASAAYEPHDAEYGADVRVTFSVPVAELDAFRAQLADATAGTATMELEREGS